MAKFSFFDPSPGMSRPNRVRTGAIFVAFIAIFVWILYTKPSVPFLSGGGTELKAELASAANVRPGYTPVRVHGVEVGQVTEIERGPSGRGAIITMKLEDGSGVDLKQDVWLALRWRTLLGRNIYVDLHPGSPSAPKWDGAMVPKTRTQDQVELDTALEPLDAKGRKGLQTMIIEFDKAFAAPQAVQRSVDAATPTFRAAGKGLPAMRGLYAGDLPKLIANTSRALGELARDEVALGNLVTNGAGALGVTAARRADLAATLNTAPAALRETRTTMVRLVRDARRGRSARRRPAARPGQAARRRQRDPPHARRRPAPAGRPQADAEPAAAGVHRPADGLDPRRAGGPLARQHDEDRRGEDPPVPQGDRSGDQAAQLPEHRPGRVAAPARPPPGATGTARWRTSRPRSARTPSTRRASLSSPTRTSRRRWSASWSRERSPPPSRRAGPRKSTSAAAPCPRASWRSSSRGRRS